MSNIYKNVTELIGRTPLVEIENVEKRFKLQAQAFLTSIHYTRFPILFAQNATPSLRSPHNRIVSHFRCASQPQ